jgi:hypothetical protein
MPDLPKSNWDAYRTLLLTTFDRNQESYFKHGIMYQELIIKGYGITFAGLITALFALDGGSLWVETIKILIITTCVGFISLVVGCGVVLHTIQKYANCQRENLIDIAGGEDNGASDKRIEREKKLAKYAIVSKFFIIIAALTIPLSLLTVVIFIDVPAADIVIWPDYKLGGV